MDTPPTQVIVQDVDYIKISKGMRGNFSWDIKVIGHDVQKAKKVNEELEEAFPNTPYLSKSED